METYQILNLSFYICLAVAVVFFIASLLLFFLFDIRSIIAARTGKMKAKTIQEMEEASGATGRLIHKKNPTHKTGKLTDKDGKIKKGVVLTPAQQAGTAITEKIDNMDETTPLSGGGNEQTTMLNGSSEQTTLLGGSNEQTALLNGSNEQTTILNSGAAETSILGDNSAETSLLGANNAAETSLFDSPTQRFGEAETSVLVQSANVPVVENVRFEIVKKVVCRDTEETI